MSFCRAAAPPEAVVAPAAGEPEEADEAEDDDEDEDDDDELHALRLTTAPTVIRAIHHGTTRGTIDMNGV
jgi:hypothetical protein